jgi:hypothetical protein
LWTHNSAKVQLIQVVTFFIVFFICLRNGCNVRILNKVEHLWKYQEISIIQPSNKTNHLHIINIVDSKKRNNISSSITISVSKLHAFNKKKILSIKTGMSKEMPPSESTLTMTSPSSLADSSISLTLDENAQ